MGSHPESPRAEPEPTTGQLVTQLSEQTSRLVRDELRLAQAELKDTARHAAAGAGLFGTAGILGLYGLGVLFAAAVAALALVLPVWASAAIVGAVLLACAGVTALVGNRQVRQVSPTPQRTVESLKRDVSEMREASHHDGAR